MKKYLTVGLVLVLVVSAAAAVLVSNGPDAPYGTVDLGQDAKPAGLLEDILGALSPPTPGPAPTAAPPGYEPAGPGDRTPAGEPDNFRKFMGFVDGYAPGVFASYCELSHSLKDDPIVFPGQPGASHLHDFFGAAGANANSTPDSLRFTESNCNFFGDSGSYWVPRVYEDGVPVLPEILGTYYRAGNKAINYIEAFPRGLKVVVRSDKWKWYCTNDLRASKSGKTSPLDCPEGDHLGLEIVFPDCWDGKYLDVPDHQSHMAYGLAQGGCPSSHPVFVPQMTYFIGYPTSQATGDLKLAPLENPSAVHADFLNSWDQAQLARYVRDCIKADVFCGSTPPP